MRQYLRAVRKGARLSVAVALATLMITGVLAWAASTANRNSDYRLLQLQVRQVAAALGTLLPVVQTELTDALQVAVTVDSRAEFRRFAVEADTTDGSASLSLWRRTGADATPLVLAGTEPQLVLDGKAAYFFSRLRPGHELQVSGVLDGPAPRIGYAEMPPKGHGLIIYAESVLPADHKLVLPGLAPFEDLDFSLYLGGKTGGAPFVETSAPVLAGLTASAPIPFGNTVIVLVGMPTTQLAGRLSADLIWVVLAAGSVLALVSAATVEYMVRRRQLAEHLARDNERLYLEQRDIAGTMQRALLPKMQTPGGIEIAARYIPGTASMDVGGDWYDLVNIDSDRCVFVVGDVSGHGLRAAAIMASLRYTTRAYIVSKDRPGTVLTRLNELLHQELQDEDMFVTVLIGEIDRRRHRMGLASAGHPPPLLVSAAGAELLPVPVGTPIGVHPEHRPPTKTFTMPSAATLFAYTDGLIERRAENISASLERLRQAAAYRDEPVAQALQHLVGTMIPDGAQDDAVVLGLRW
jgi:serine phosphatase RsbU (regulator of sigma subunit)